MAKPLYHASLYEFDRAQPSYWEASADEPPLEGNRFSGTERCDVAIVGGGYTGLSAALHLARNLRPSIGRMPEDPSVYFAYGYHGNGVNSATWSGRELAKWLAGKTSGSDPVPKRLPAIVRGRPPRFPLPRLRRQYLRLAMKYYRLCDRLGW